MALLDWDFAAPADELYDPVTLLMSARCPRPDRPGEYEARAVAARRALAGILDGYGADAGQRRRATTVAAASCDDAADYLLSLGPGRAGARSTAEFGEEVARRRFLADWWRTQPPM